LSIRKRARSKSRPTRSLAFWSIPSFRPEDKNSLRVIIDGLAQSGGGGEMKSDPGTYIGIFDRIHFLTAIRARSTMKTT
jgi:hypothetical protein